jgi:multiple sugar transport system substrate-binding protein
MLQPSFRSPRRWTRRQMLWLTFGSGLAACAVQPSGPRTSQKVNSAALEIWWTKGLILVEDEVIQAIVQDWQTRSGIPVRLSFHKQGDILQKAERAVQSGQGPDVLYAYKGDLTLQPQWAWQGKLVDLSEIVEPVQAQYMPTVLSAAALPNGMDNRRRYYGMPLSQEATYAFYRRDLLARVGLGDRPIPSDWESFWRFWQELQAPLRSFYPNFHSLGLPASPNNSDTQILFEYVLQAHGVQVVDRQGQWRLEQPDVRQGIAQCLDWYTRFYHQNYVPPKASQWLTPDNNRALLNQEVAMTVNPSMSIPVSQRDNRTVYAQALGTADLPRGVEGKPVEHLVSVNQAVIPTTSQRPDQAKAFLTYLSQPAVLNRLVRGAGGRFAPVITEAWRDPFWTDRTDPHIPLQTQTLRDRPVRLLLNPQVPAYSEVFRQDVWGKAIQQVAARTLSAEQGADAAIQQIQRGIATWQ